MLDGLQYFLAALVSFLEPATLFIIGWATLLGITVGMLPGFSVWLRTLAVTGSSATIKYRVETWELDGITRSDLDADWEMSGEAELDLGVCYLRTIATDDPQLKVAVLLRLVSVSHPDQKENTEA